MEKKLPNIFKKDVSREHITNSKIFASNKNIKNNSVREDTGVSVEDKIKKLFRSNRYVFNIGVIIKTKNEEYDTKIIGRIKNSLITAEEEVIPIIEIEDIIIKDHI